MSRIEVNYDPKSFVGRWIDAHRSTPWFGAVPWRANETSRASALYEAYRQDANDDDRAVLSERDFGLTLQAAGFEPERDEDGRYYSNIGPKTRAWRALSQARDEVMSPIRARCHEAARERHFATVSHVRVEREIAKNGVLSEREVEDACDHDAPRDFMGLSRAEPIWIVEGDEAAAEEIKAGADQIEAEAKALVAQWYQPLVDWRPGEPDPVARLVARRRVPEDRARLAEVEADIAALQPDEVARLEAALAVYQAYEARYKAAERDLMDKGLWRPRSVLDQMTAGIMGPGGKTRVQQATTPEHAKYDAAHTGGVFDEPAPERVDGYALSKRQAELGRLVDKASMLRSRIESDEAILKAG